MAATPSSALRVRAFAKINLGLKIIGKRADGYHEIRTIYQTIALHDTLELSIHPRGRLIELVCSDSSIPSGSGNLVFRACKLWKRANKFYGGVVARLRKRIPPGSGLGGASADAAAAIAALEALTGRRQRSLGRYELAARLGSDVPFFLFGGRALGIGRGEEVYPLADLPSRDCLVVVPGFSISTAEAYAEAGKLFAKQLTNRPSGHNMSTFGAWSHFPQNDWGPAENDFERVVFARWPQLASLKRQLIRAGAEVASLTGSGSAVFGLFDSARSLARATKVIPKGWQVFRTRTLSRVEYRRLLIETTAGPAARVRQD